MHGPLSKNEGLLGNLEKDAYTLKRRLKDDWPCNTDDRENEPLYCVHLSKQMTSRHAYYYTGLHYEEMIGVRGEAIGRMEKKAAIELLEQSINSRTRSQERTLMLDAENCSKVIDAR